ncbi:MAG: CDP-alcohol phosphatidyltransferase family protein [Desulfotalea sp.]
MFDRQLLPYIQIPALVVAKKAKKIGFSANGITVLGFILGLVGVACISLKFYLAGLFFVLVNRLLDVIDGEVARLGQPTDQGAYLDIVLDFIFYSLVVVGFALSDPVSNGLASAILLASFMGTGASFLAFAIMAEKKGLALTFPKKGFYYLGGLTEGFETVLFFSVFCLFPVYFPLLAYLFSFLCVLTTISRISFACKTI